MRSSRQWLVRHSHQQQFILDNKTLTSLLSQPLLSFPSACKASDMFFCIPLVWGFPTKVSEISTWKEDSGLEEQLDRAGPGEHRRGVL